MKLNVDVILRELDGAPIVHPSGKDVTLGLVICELLLPQKDMGSGADKASRYQLACKVHQGGEIDFKVEELAKIKELCDGIPLNGIVVGQVIKLIDAIS